MVAGSRLQREYMVLLILSNEAFLPSSWSIMFTRNSQSSHFASLNGRQGTVLNFIGKNNRDQWINLRKLIHSYKTIHSYTTKLYIATKLYKCTSNSFCFSLSSLNLFATSAKVSSITP